MANFTFLARWAHLAKELTEKDGWLIEWTPIKTGRKVTDLRFEFKREPQASLDL